MEKHEHHGYHDSSTNRKDIHAHRNNHHDHGHHSKHSTEEFRSRFFVSLLLTIPVLYYSHHIQLWLNFSPPHFPGDKYIPFLLGTFIYFYGGKVFLLGAWEELKGRNPGMMTLITMAISVAFGYSLAVTMGMPGDELYWELATLVTIMLLGHWLELQAIQRASGALQELAELLPDKATRIINGGTEDVPVSALAADDKILIRPGGQVPSDGIVIEGASYVNESMLTGESTPVHKGQGDWVFAGTVIEDGSLRVRIEKAGKDTTLAGIMRLVEQAQASRSHTQVLADRAAFWLVLVAFVAAGMTAIAWSAAKADSSFILERVVTVLIISCPHALGLAIPLVTAISTTLSAKNGLLAKDRLALEEARLVNCVVFDKTGTLTKGEQTIVAIHTAEESEGSELLRLAAAAEADSEHMIASGILKAAEERELTIPKAASFSALPGKGIEANIEDKKVFVGGPNLIQHLGLSLPSTLKEQASRYGVEGKSIVWVVVDGQVSGFFVMSDIIRDESREAVAALKSRGIKVVMLTGDSKGVAEKISVELGIDSYYAEVLPEYKADKIKRLRDEGYRVAMVGDGVNDAPALAVADVGFAIGAGTDIAVESAGIILMRNDPRDVVRLINLSRASYRKMKQNLAWAVGYNALAIPLAAGVLAPAGFILPMAAGAVVMSASTIIVALNAQLLWRFSLGKTNVLK